MTEMFAISKAGHDKGQMYVILKEEGEYLYLVDGKTRGVDNPKKKKKKHVQPVKTGADEKTCALYIMKKSDLRSKAEQIRR